MREFASEYPRTPEGWVIFPNDVPRRKQLFPQEVMKHPAKMQLFMEQSIIEYVSEPGETLLDPMSGSGTIMIGLLMCRNVICLEIEEMYHSIQQMSLAKIKAHPDCQGDAMLLQGNCKLLLPLPCDHIIFSPPYGAAFKPSKEVGEFQASKYRIEQGENVYAKTQGNVGMSNTFLYNMDMEKVYRLCYQSLRKGGTISIVTKDITEAGQRIYLTKWIDKVCKQIGFEFDNWFKAQMMGGPYQDMRRAQGLATIDDEDITIYRKP